MQMTMQTSFLKNISFIVMLDFKTCTFLYTCTVYVNLIFFFIFQIIIPVFVCTSIVTSKARYQTPKVGFSLWLVLFGCHAERTALACSHIIQLIQNRLSFKKHKTLKSERARNNGYLHK